MKKLFKQIIVAIITWQAKCVLKKFHPKIIAVTGSVGKTSTKDAIFTVLDGQVSIRKNQKSFNSEIGTPLTILGLENAWGSLGGWVKNIFNGFRVMWFGEKYPEWLVLEVGADHPNDIKKITTWLKPAMVVITRIPKISVHIANFPDSESILQEKAQLFYSLTKDGVAFLNADDERIMSLTNSAHAKIVSFGLSDKADIQLKEVNYLYENGRVLGIQALCQLADQKTDFELRGVVGKHLLYAWLIAIGLAKEFNLPLAGIKDKISHAKPAPGRMNLLSGVNHSTIIDDSYNSSPVASKAALDTISTITTEGRKIAVLGEMRELGKYSESEHQKVGEFAVNNVDILIAVGVEAKEILNGWKKYGGGEHYYFDDAAQAGEFLNLLLKPNDLILLKGSQGIRIERAVKRILANPAEAEEKLVRQSREWLEIS